MQAVSVLLGQICGYEVLSGLKLFSSVCLLRRRSKEIAGVHDAVEVICYGSPYVERVREKTGGLHL